MKKTNVKIIPLIFAIICLIFCLTACKDKSEPLPTPTTQPEPTEEPVDVLPVDVSIDSPYVIKDAALVRNSYIHADIVDFRDDGDVVIITLNLRNSSNEHAFGLILPDCVINGCQVELAWAESLAPSEVKRSDLLISHDMLNDRGLLPIDEIVFHTVTYVQQDDSESVPEIYLDDSVTVYPTGKAPEEISSTERPEQEGDSIVLDNDICTFIILGSQQTEAGLDLPCYIVNHADRDVTVTMENMTVNGSPCDPGWGLSLNADTRIYSDIVFPIALLEEANINVDEVDSIRFTLSVYDNANWINPLVENHICEYHA